MSYALCRVSARDGVGSRLTDEVHVNVLDLMVGRQRVQLKHCQLVRPDLKTGSREQMKEPLRMLRFLIETRVIRQRGVASQLRLVDR